MYLKQSTFYDAENSKPLVGLEPTISRLHNEFHLQPSCLRWSKQCIANIFLNIRDSKPRNNIRKWQNYELQMSDGCHFEFYEFTAWHMPEMDSAQKFHIETTNEILFLKNAYRSFSRAVFHLLTWLYAMDTLFALPSLCAGNPSLFGGFQHNGPQIEGILS